MRCSVVSLGWEETVARKRTDTVALTLRVREDLRRRLEREAKKRDHSLNTEMVRRLEETFQPERDALVNLIAGNDTNATAMHMIAEVMVLARTLRWRHSVEIEDDPVEQHRAEQDRSIMIQAAVNLILAEHFNLNEELPKAGDTGPVQDGRRLAYFVLERRFGPSARRVQHEFQQELEREAEDRRLDDMMGFLDDERMEREEKEDK